MPCCRPPTANELPILKGKTVSTEQKIESEIQAKGLTAPRLSPEDLDRNIAHTEIVKHVSHSGQVLRWAVLTTRNGFAVTGRPSASVSAANDDQEIGEKLAMDNARQELWPLMGYQLREQLYQAQQPAQAPTESAFPPHQQRVIAEKVELDGKLDKLIRFIIAHDVFKTLDIKEQARLLRQARNMEGYSCVLGERIEAFGETS